MAKCYADFYYNLGRLPLIADHPIHPVIPIEAYQHRPPAPNLPPTQGVVPRMGSSTVPPRIMTGDPNLVRARFDDISRNTMPVGQPQVRFPGQEGEIRPGWMPADREWVHPMHVDGAWMTPRSGSGPVPGVPHGVRHERPPFIRGTTPFY